MNKENKNILVSVVVSFYNDTKDYVNETLQSIANQKDFDMNQLEVVMVDDGSTVDITKLISKYKKLIPNFCYYKKIHGDRSSVFEYVKENQLLHGNYFSFLDSDDIWKENMMSNISKYLDKGFDSIITNFYRWYPTKNKIKKTPVIIDCRSKIFNLWKNKKQMHLLNTPYSWPIGKFDKTKRFYELKFEKKCKNDIDKHDDAILFHICPDVVWYHENLKSSKKILHLKKYLAFARQDRPNSFSNREWDASKVRTWTKTINYLTSVNASCKAFFYLIFKKFVNAYLKFQNDIKLEPIILKKKIDVDYLPKILHPLVKLFIKLKLKKISKKIPVKFVD